MKKELLIAGGVAGIAGIAGIAAAVLALSHTIRRKSYV